MLNFTHPEVVHKFLKNNNLSNYRPDLKFLTKLGNLFQKMPYENLTKIIRKQTLKNEPSRLRTPEILYEEYLRYGTGGTCFSMTYFMQTILRACGYKTYPVIADRPLAPNTHCLSVIILDGDFYILDPGFMISTPVKLSKEPIRKRLGHNVILIGLIGTISIPYQQLKYLDEFDGNNSPYRIFDDERYVIATEMHKKRKIRYFFNNKALSFQKFLDYWTNSFSWPTMNNISITTKISGGYLYARNNFIRTSTYEDKKQERIKDNIEETLGKTFNIKSSIIKSAFEIINEKKRRK